MTEGAGLFALVEPLVLELLSIHLFAKLVGLGILKIGVLGLEGCNLSLFFIMCLLEASLFTGDDFLPLGDYLKPSGLCGGGLRSRLCRFMHR